MLTKYNSFIDPEPYVQKYGETVTPTVAAKMIGVSRRTLGRETEAGRLPLLAFGKSRTLRYRTRDIVAMLQRVA